MGGKYSSVEKHCLRCGAYLKGAQVKEETAHSRVSGNWMGFVQFRRKVYICPWCGAPNTRDTRVTWGGSEGKH